jgi:hypothetical protein
MKISSKWIIILRRLSRDAAMLRRGHFLRTMIMTASSTMTLWSEGSGLVKIHDEWKYPTQLLQAQSQ